MKVKHIKPFHTIMIIALHFFHKMKLGDIIGYEIMKDGMVKILAIDKSIYIFDLKDGNVSIVKNDRVYHWGIDNINFIELKI